MMGVVFLRSLFGDVFFLGCGFWSLLFVWSISASIV